MRFGCKKVRPLDVQWTYTFRVLRGGELLCSACVQQFGCGVAWVKGGSEGFVFFGDSVLSISSSVFATVVEILGIYRRVINHPISPVISALLKLQPAK